MGRKPKEHGKKEVQIGVRLTKELDDAISAEIEQIKATSGVEVPKSAVIRAWLEEAMRAAVARRK